MSVAEIQKNVSGLPEKERAKLAAWLLDSLPPSSEDDAGTASLEEAVRRREELDSGRVQPVPEKEFWAGIDLERGQWEGSSTRWRSGTCWTSSIITTTSRLAACRT